MEWGGDDCIGWFGAEEKDDAAVNQEWAENVSNQHPCWEDCYPFHHHAAVFLQSCPTIIQQQMQTATSC